LTGIILETDKSSTQDTKAKRNKRLKRLGIWLSVELFVILLVLFLIFRSPSGYQQAESIESDLVSPYLTNYLMPKIYSGAQEQKPFELVVHQSGINDIISRRSWPIVFQELVIFTPQTYFTDGKITLQGMVSYKGADIVITVEAAPAIDDNGLLNFNVQGLRVGSMNITMIAKFVASRMYQKRLSEYHIDTTTLEAQIAGSMLNATPFEPVFELEDKYIRIQKIDLRDETLAIDFLPAGHKSRNRR